MAGLFVSDLDDTLVFRCPPELESSMVVVDRPRVGAPIGMTARAARMLHELNSRGMFAPVTARARANYARVRLPGGQPRFAAVAGGGVLLVDGQPDHAWREQVAEAMTSAASLEQMHRLLGATPGVGEPRNVDDVYVNAAIVNHDAFVAGSGPMLAQARDAGWAASVQHVKIHLYPAAVTKERAMREIAARLGADRVVTAGDSLMDAELVAAGRPGMFPAIGELHELGWSSAYAIHVDAPVPLAGEQILGNALYSLTRHGEVLLPCAAPHDEGRH